MADQSVDGEMSRPDSLRDVIAGQERGFADTPWAPSSELSEWDWPPVSYAENDHILVWWLPEYDDLLRRLVDEYQWAWRSEVLSELESSSPRAFCGRGAMSIPSAVNTRGTTSSGSSWPPGPNSLAFARASRNWSVCSCCSREFLESHLSWRYIVRLRREPYRCVRHLPQPGTVPGRIGHASTPEAVTAVLRTLSRALGRPPKDDRSLRPVDLQGLSRDARAAVVSALRVKPAVSRVKELSDPWIPPSRRLLPLRQHRFPRIERPRRSSPTGAEFTSTDPARYRSLTGRLLRSRWIDVAREPWTYAEELQSLVGTGYLALAEAALKHADTDRLSPAFSSPCCSAGIRPDGPDRRRACCPRRRLWRGQQFRRPGDPAPRHPHLTSGPDFYEPLGSLPRGNVRFVLVGGPMEYVDRRGEHSVHQRRGASGERRG